jgi:IS5 family transposase
METAELLRQFRTDPSTPAGFGVTSGVSLDDLAKGVMVVREIRRVGPKWFTTETPCCARPLRLPADPDGDQWAMCCHCGITYLVDREQEESDGYDDKPAFVAVFTVERTGVAAAMHSRGRTEPRRPPALSGRLSAGR